MKGYFGIQRYLFTAGAVQIRMSDRRARVSFKALGLNLVMIALFLVFQPDAMRAQVTGVVEVGGQNNQSQVPQPDVVTLGNGIDYHTGPVMSGPHHVYFIWYGNWSGNTATTILPAFISALNASSYFNTNTTYGDNNGNVTNSVSMSGQVFDNYSQGSLLTDQAMQSVVSSKLVSGALPIDTNGVYFVLSSADVDQNS